MSGPVGLVTGSLPFAGLPSNPAEIVLSHIEGLEFSGIRIVTQATPVSFARLPALLPALVAEHRPVFVLALGLALGAPVLRVETLGVNAAHFGIADNEGAQPSGGQAFAADGPVARRATWDGEAVVAAIEAEGVPARLSFHAGTHLCNLTLYTYLGALEGAPVTVPCGFLHLPYLPEQIVWMKRQANAPERAPGTPYDQPSMALETQLRAVRATLAELARQALHHASRAAAPGHDERETMP